MTQQPSPEPFVWHWKDESGRWQPYSSDHSHAIDSLGLKDYYKMLAGGHTYEVLRTAEDRAVQTDVFTDAQTECTRLGDYGESWVPVYTACVLGWKLLFLVGSNVCHHV